MPQGMEDNFIKRINTGRIESAFISGAIKSLGIAGADVNPASAGKDQIGRAFVDPLFKYRPDCLGDTVGFTFSTVPSPIINNATLHIHTVQMQIAYIRRKESGFLGDEGDGILIHKPTGKHNNSLSPFQSFHEGVPGCIIERDTAPPGFTLDLPDPRFMLQVMNPRASHLAKPGSRVQGYGGNQKPLAAVRVDGVQQQGRFTLGQESGSGVVHLGHAHLLKGTVSFEQPPFFELIDHVPHITQYQTDSRRGESFFEQSELVIFQFQGSDLVYRLICEKRSRVDSVAQRNMLFFRFGNHFSAKTS